jgi:hypothetical protein
MNIESPLHTFTAATLKTMRAELADYAQNLTKDLNIEYGSRDIAQLLQLVANDIVRIDEALADK